MLTGITTRCSHLDCNNRLRCGSSHHPSFPSPPWECRLLRSRMQQQMLQHSSCDHDLCRRLQHSNYQLKPPSDFQTHTSPANHGSGKAQDPRSVLPSPRIMRSASTTRRSKQRMSLHHRLQMASRLASACGSSSNNDHRGPVRARPHPLRRRQPRRRRPHLHPPRRRPLRHISCRALLRTPSSVNKRHRQVR